VSVLHPFVYSLFISCSTFCNVTKSNIFKIYKIGTTGIGELAYWEFDSQESVSASRKNDTAE